MKNEDAVWLVIGSFFFAVVASSTALHLNLSKEVSTGVFAVSLLIGLAVWWPHAAPKFAPFQRAGRVGVWLITAVGLAVVLAMKWGI